MNFLEAIFHRLSHASGQPVLGEVHEGGRVTAAGGEMLAMIRRARAFLHSAGAEKGNRCALLAHNSIRWAALDLAMMAEGMIVVPLYARQPAAEWVGMMKDCSPALVCCGDVALRDAIARSWADAPRLCLFDEIFVTGGVAENVPDAPLLLAEADPVTIIYTSGTSGDPKGVILNAGNVTHMLGCTNARLDLLMGPRKEPDRVFHYLPFCFAGSWILLLTCLSRNSVLALSTDLSKLAEEIRVAAPNYFLNVPAVLERIRSGIDQQFRQRGGIVSRIYENAKAAWFRGRAGTPNVFDRFGLALGKALVFPAIRKKLGPNLRALICGSAPLAVETQLFFLMLGVPVLQVYGLTETTAICTLDDPHRIEPGRVGPAIPGIEMKVGENGEIFVRGPNVFPGYWNRAEETSKAFAGSWLHTGDQGEVDSSGNWRIVGRVKNLIILNSGHNIAPEPMEDTLLRSIPGAQQVMLVGNNRSYLAAIVAGRVSREQVEATLATVNEQFPHYRCIRAFHIHPEPFSAENGLLTANGKLKRDAITTVLRAQIEDLYRKPQS